MRVSKWMDSLYEAISYSNALAQKLDAKIRERTARVGIVGLGYVGLPLAAAVNHKGFDTFGFDVDPEKVGLLASGRSYIKTVSEAVISKMNASGKFRPTNDFSRIAEVDAVLVCVPTPLGKHREPDLSYIITTAETIQPYLREGCLIVLESTTYPGTTSGVLKPVLEKGGLRSGRTIFLAYSPEREDPGNLDFETSTIPKVVGGDGSEAAALAQAFYGSFIDRVVPVSSLETAEAVKLTENIFRSVNIALVNELKVIYTRMGINIWEVIDAAKTKPFGYMPFYPGPGLGGHCIPIDPFYLTWKAREYEVPTRFIELAGEINNHAPHFVVETLVQALGQRKQRSLNGAKVLMLGVAYKKNVDDMRESPALVLTRLLECQGASVDYYDPHIPVIPMTREFSELSGRYSIAWKPAEFAKYDAALICTDHDGVNYQELVNHLDLVIDSRNATRLVTEGRDRVVLA